MVCGWQSLSRTLPLFPFRPLSSFGAIDDSTAFSGRLHPVSSAMRDVPHYWTADQVQRVLDALKGRAMNCIGVCG